jgi:hypothetical protein
MRGTVPPAMIASGFVSRISEVVHRAWTPSLSLRGSHAHSLLPPHAD